jgi:uncharacterized protein (DUF2141 family)
MRKLASITAVVMLAIAFSNVARSDESASKGDLVATVTNTRDDKGRVGCSLFNDSNPAAFPRDSDKSFRRTWADIKGGTASCGFKDVPAGTYAIVVFQDEDMTGKMRNNFMGMPQEGFGFSQNPVVRFSAPSFTDASFKYDGNHQTVPINLQYYGGK